MARSRNIKPGLFKNEVLGEADPLLTILFTGLWCLADREGRLEDRPKRIKAEIFPYREIPDFNGYLTELEQLGFIRRYSVENQTYIQIENFLKHQSPHKTEKPSDIPEPLKETRSCTCTIDSPLNNESLTVKESLIPDSLNTDLLIQEKKQTEPPAGLSDDEEKPKKTEPRKQKVEEVFDHLRLKTGTNFKAIHPDGTYTAGGKQCDALLKKGYEDWQLNLTITGMVSEWKGTDMERNLTPETLFRPSNFPKYLARHE